MATTYYSDNGNIRGVLIYSTSITDTQVTVTIQGQLEFKSLKQAGYYIETSIDGVMVDSATGYATSSYSKWTKCVDTGAYSKVYNRTHADQIVTIGSKYYGEKVDGWNAGSKSGNTSVQITIPAKPSYSVSYEANGGNDAPDTQTKWYNETLKLSTEIPNRNGYTFVCWNTEADGSGASYYADGTYTQNDDLILYAIWKRNSNCYIKDNGTYKKGQIYINKGGSWKKGVPWIKVNGVWKRGGA